MGQLPELERGAKEIPLLLLTTRTISKLEPRRERKRQLLRISNKTISKLEPRRVRGEATFCFESPTKEDQKKGWKPFHFSCQFRKVLASKEMNLLQNCSKRNKYHNNSVASCWEFLEPPSKEQFQTFYLKKTAGVQPNIPTTETSTSPYELRAGKITILSAVLGNNLCLRSPPQIALCDVQFPGQFHVSPKVESQHTAQLLNVPLCGTPPTVAPVKLYLVLGVKLVVSQSHSAQHEHWNIGSERRDVPRTVFSWIRSVLVPWWQHGRAQ